MSDSCAWLWKRPSTLDNEKPFAVPHVSHNFKLHLQRINIPPYSITGYHQHAGVTSWVLAGPPPLPLYQLALTTVQPGVNLAFLSARPESVRGFTEADSFKNIFNPLLKRGELYCAPVLLLGSLHSGPAALISFMLGNK